MVKEIIVGRIVFSKSGKDKGLPFVVCYTKDNFVYLIDGKTRKMINPKKKNNIHVAKTNHLINDMENKLNLIYGTGDEIGYSQQEANKLMLKDSDIRTEIKGFLNVNEV